VPTWNQSLTAIFEGVSIINNLHIYERDLIAGSARRALMACTRPPKRPRPLLSSVKNGARPPPTSFFRSGSASFSKPSSMRKIFGSTAKADILRHTYICLRLMEGADIYQIAKNCRTSVEMIEKYYAAHIKTSLDAAAINVMRSKKLKKRSQQKVA
jgi:hypothetical protein